MHFHFMFYCFSGLLILNCFFCFLGILVSFLSVLYSSSFVLVSLAVFSVAPELCNHANLSHVGKLLLYCHFLLPCKCLLGGNDSSQPPFRIVCSFLKSSLMIPSACP